MLILKIMSSLDCADTDPSKGFKLISDVLNVKFTTNPALTYEKTIMKSEGIECSDGESMISYAHCIILDDSSPCGQREESHLLTGNCYVLNDRGKTIETFWARRSTTGDLVGEP